MELTERRMRILKSNLYFMGVLFLLILFSSILIDSFKGQRLHSQYDLWGCLLFYLAVRMMPFFGFSIMIYLASYGYKKGYVEEYFEHSTRGVLTGDDAKKLGRNQIAIGIIAFGLSLFGAFADVTVLAGCPEFFYHATWTQVFEKLF